MTKNTIVATLGILTACAVTLCQPALAQVTYGYAPVTPPTQDGGYTANARPFSVASAYDGPPPAATRVQATVAPSVTAPVIETGYRGAAGTPTPALNYYPQPAASLQTASYQPATSAYYRSVVNGYSQPVSTAYPTSYVPSANQIQQVNYAQPIQQVQQVNNLQPIAATQPALGGTNPCCCPTTTMSPGAPTLAPVNGQAFAVPAQRDYAWSPVVALRPMPSDFTVGQGLLGQPKVYVEGEPVRNFFRYILP